MKQIYFLSRNLNWAILLLFISIISLTLNAQTTETFESQTDGLASFTSNSVPFTLEGGITIANAPAFGYLSSNKYIDSYNVGISSCKIKSTSSFSLKSLYLYPSVYADGNTNQTVGVSVTFTGKLAGTTKFTYTPPSSDFAAAIWSNPTNRGFSLVNFATPGYDNTTIDELDVTLGGGAQYVAIDNFTWGAVAANSAPTNIALSASAINENVVANSTVGTLSSTDPDAGNTFTYTLVAGTGSTDNASFNISSNSLRITNSPNFEAKSSYTVRIRTTDQGSLTFEKAFTITISDLVEASTVLSVGVPSNATYIASQNLDFTVNFNEAVTVNTGVGTPYIPVTLSTGGTVNAAYLSGSGTSALVFRYTIVTGNADADGIALGGSIAANGGTIRNGSSLDAILTLNSVGSTTGVLVDAIAPTVSSVSVPSNATYIASQNLDFTVNFSEAITVNTGGGIPYISITLNTGGTVNAAYASGTGTTALVFRYAIASGNADPDGVSIGVAITANGGMLKDAAGNSATLALNSVGSTTGILVDAIAPTVSSVSVPSNATYVAIQNLDFTVYFSEAVTVNVGGGTPYVSITLGTGGAVHATYFSGSGTIALVFRYTIVNGNGDNDGIAVGASITANGGTIKDAAGNNTILTLNSIGSTSGVLVDAIAPTVSSVGVPANATYITDQNLDFTVNFSEPVTVVTSGGMPFIAITLNTGGSVNASYQSGSGTSAIVFRYTIVAGNEDNNGVAVGAFIWANGGTLSDAAGNSALPTLNSIGSTTGVLVDGIAPIVSSVGVPSSATYTSGQNLDFTVNFSEAVTIVTTGGTPYVPVILSTGGTVHAAYLSGSGTSALVFRYTVVAGNDDNDGVALDIAIIANGGTLKDAAGNGAILTLNSVPSSSGVVVDALSPTVSSVSAPANATYISGQNLDFTVNFSEAVTLNTSGGTPYVPITLGTGGVVHASYQSGSGATALVFRYTVLSGNADNDGVAIGAAITANGGTIKDAAGNNATLTLNSIGSTSGVLVDAIVPTISSVGAPANGIYTAGQNLDFTVNFNKAIIVVTSGGMPYIPVTLNTGGTVNASYQSGSGTAALVFRYTVVTGNDDNNGVAVGASITANGGTLKDAVGNSATLTLNSIGSTLNVLVDAIIPTVSSVLASSNATYSAGQNLDFTVNLSETITVVTTGGTPYIPITLNIGGIVNASYQSGSGTTALVFRYAIVVGNSDNDGVSVGSSIAANGGILKDAAGNNAAITLNSIGSTTGVLVDAIAPVVSSVSVPANATYITGQNLDFTVNFNEAVTVVTTGGTPYIPVTLNTGGMVNAAYLSGSGTSALIFRYTVVSGNADNNGVTVSSSITANGGTLKDAAGNNVTLTLNSIGSTTSVLVDAIAPTISSVSVPSNGTYRASQNLDFTVNFGEAVTLVTTGGAPYIPVTLNTGGIVNASYQSGSGTTALVFRYTVVSGNDDNDGVAVGSSITANGGTLKDAAGNNATLTLNSIGSTASVLVDTNAPTVSSVGVPANATYMATQNLDFTVNFNDPVTVVTTTGGTPYVPITLNTGGAVNAAYVSGSGTSALVFRYTVIAGNADNDGVTVGSSITANGGTLKDVAGNNATLTLNSIGSTTGVLVDGITPPCINPSLGGTIDADQNGCNPFDPSMITSSGLPTGSTGTLEYKWQQSITSNSTGFSDIASSNATTYDPGSITATTWYKRVARVSCKIDWSGAAESNVVAMTVAPVSVGGNISGTSPITYGSSTGTMTLNGHTGTVVKWQKMLGSGSWVDIANTSTTYSETPTSAGTWQYRAQVKSGACSDAFSASFSMIISPKTLTVGGSFAAINKVYDGLTTATIATNSLTLATKEGSDDVTLAAMLVFDTKTVGTTKTVSLTGSSLTGANASNYTLSLTSAPTATADITAASLVITGVTATTKVYDGTNTATLTGGTISGKIGSDVVTITAGTGAFTNQNVGTAKTVTAFGYAIAGTDATNYTLAAQPTVIAADITIRPITITANSGQSKKAGVADPALTYAITNGSLVTGELLTGTLSRAVGEIVGNYAIQIGTLSAGNNYNVTFVSADFTITANTSVINISADKPNVYPNPTSGLVILEIPGHVSVLDFNGKVILEISLDNNKTIDLSGFASGVYILILKTKDSVYEYKIMKQ